MRDLRFDLNRNVAFIAVFILSALLFNSCGTDQKTLLPKVSGSAGEILVVVNKNYWDSPLGDSVEHWFEGDFTSLPQSEPMFNIIQIPRSAFNNIFQTHRNIVDINIDSEFEEAKLSLQRNKYSTPQYIYKVVAPNQQAALQLLQEESNYLIDQFNRIERSRLIQSYKQTQDQAIYNTLKEDHHVALVVPSGYSLDVNEDDFAWLSLETPTTSQGVLLYHYPYEGESDFDLEQMLNRRNSFLKTHVPGPTAGSYMATEETLPPVTREFMSEKKYFMEIRGLWRVENAFMGGPFVSLSTVDETRNRIVTVEGFVYAPKADKRNLMRQVEAVVYSLQIIEEEENNNQQ